MVRLLSLNTWTGDSEDMTTYTGDSENKGKGKGKDMKTCAGDCEDKGKGKGKEKKKTKETGTSVLLPGLKVLHDGPAVSRDFGGGETLEVVASGSEAMLTRPCVDCGLVTGRFCDYCRAADRIPDEEWAHGQLTPLCSKCDNVHDGCHFCRGLRWCRPPKWKPGPNQVMYFPGPEIAPGSDQVMYFPGRESVKA